MHINLSKYSCAGGDDTLLISADGEENVLVCDFCPKLSIAAVEFIHIASFLCVRPRINPLHSYHLQLFIGRSPTGYGKPMTNVSHAKDKWVSFASG